METDTYSEESMIYTLVLCAGNQKIIFNTEKSRNINEGQLFSDMEVNTRRNCSELTAGASWNEKWEMFFIML